MTVSLDLNGGNMPVKDFMKNLINVMLSNNTNNCNFEFNFLSTALNNVPVDIVMKFDVLIDIEVQKNVWIDWHYTPENPYPKLDGDPLVHVRFRDGGTTMDSESVTGARPISYWHGDGFGNCFAHTSDVKEDCQIIAYMLVDESDHD